MLERNNARKQLPTPGAAFFDSNFCGAVQTAVR